MPKNLPNKRTIAKQRKEKAIAASLRFGPMNRAGYGVDYRLSNSEAKVVAGACGLVLSIMAGSQQSREYTERTTGQRAA